MMGVCIRCATECLISCITFRKWASNYRALLRKMTYEDTASYDCTAPYTYLCRNSQKQHNLNFWVTEAYIRTRPNATQFAIQNNFTALIENIYLIFHPADVPTQIEILKSPLADKFALQKDCRVHFPEFLPEWAPHRCVDSGKNSQKPARYPVCSINDKRADFWEFLPESAPSRCADSTWNFERCAPPLFCKFSCKVRSGGAQ